MTKPQILFVDDEPHVLSGLRRALSGHRGMWDFHWAESGLDALECLARVPIDILVTDMRMPGMDGAALLERSRRLHPATARIVLSGHADRDSIIGAAGPAHQFLSKPCEPGVLVATLEATIAARTLMDDASLCAILGGLDNLPKPPSVYAELAALAGRPDTTVKDISSLVERDVATTVELLKLVNSSFFGVASAVTTVQRAVSLLGLDTIQALVLAGQVFRSSVDLPPGLSAATLVQEGLRSCVAMRQIGELEGWSTTLTAQLCLAALLYDVGLLALTASRPAGWLVYQSLRADWPERQAQIEAFGCTVGQASGYLLGLWGFDPVVVRTLAEQPIPLEDNAARLNASPASLAIAEARSDAVHLVTSQAGPA
jgi:HD-like signal output (HDOD) protein/ActR/RegA family two-component response regulator